MKVIAFFKYILIGLFLTMFFLLLVFGIRLQPNDMGIIKTFGNFEKVTIVSKNILSYDNVLKNGNLYYYSFSKEQKDVENVLKNMKIEGIVLYFSKDIPFGYFKTIMGENLSKEMQVQDIKMYNGYLSDIQQFVFCDGKKVNIQLAQTERGWVLGCPLILTGF